MSQFNSTDFLHSLATKWSAKHCDDADRIGRGLAIALAGKVAPQAAGRFRVSGKKGREYTVLVNNGWPSCDCPDADKGYRCKHVWACALMTRLTTEIVARMKAPAPKPLRNDLSERCSAHHNANHERAEALKPLAPVIPLRIQK